MPTRGQTCQACSGECCKGHIGWILETGKLDLTKQSCLDYTWAEMKAAGAIEKWQDEPYSVGCSSFRNPGCALQGPLKPPLCRTWYCHGKYWKPREVGNAS